MAGTLLESKLGAKRTDAVEFCLATNADDQEIRRLLRGNPTLGKISLSFEREPNYFADAGLLAQVKQTIVARERGKLLGIGNCTIRWRFVNGEPRRVGYLGALRLDHHHAGRFDLVRRGYQLFEKLQSEAPADFYFTSIAADNERARRFLERGLQGMPHYEFIGEFVTQVLRTGNQRVARTTMESADPDSLLSRLNDSNRHYQLAPQWSADEIRSLESLGLSRNAFHFIEPERKIRSCVALWDQRCFKQTVVRGYDSWLRLMRYPANALSRIIGTPRLPEIGSTLANAFISHLAADPEQPEALIHLIVRLLQTAAKRRIELVTIGFAANDPRLNAIRHRFRHREYRSRIYIVRWPEIGGAANELDGRILAPEVALL